MPHTRLTLITALVVIVTQIMGSGVLAVDNDQKNCPECHEDDHKRLKGKFSHQPFEEELCLECHRYHGFRNKKEFNGPIIEVCTKCHTTIEDLDEESIHYPILDEMSCATCHTPHASNSSSLLLKTSPAELCTECHDGPEEEVSGYHEPYQSKSCTKCHNPHGSMFPGFFQLPPGYVCLECHPQIFPGAELSQLHSATDLNSCEQCHTGHHSDHGNLLKTELVSLCTGCHKNLGTELKRKRVHTILEEEDCLVCHEVHHQKGTNHLTDEERPLCMTCHSDIGDRLEMENVHPPADEEACTICHNPHAGMLVSSEQDICASCHDIEDTDYLSLHKTDSAPENCSSCHDPHGSDNESLVMDNQHPPFDERDCSSCHEDGQTPDDLRNPELCLNCHDQPESEGAHQADKIGEKVCISCHSPHAANRPALIKLDF